MERISITIINWRKWNPRKDYRKPSWFAMSNDLLDHPDFVDFTPLEFHALVYILSQASKRNSETIDIIPLHAMQRNINEAVLSSTIKKLERNQLLAVIRTESVQNLYSTENTENTENTVTAVVKPRARKQPERVDPQTSEEMRSILGEEWLSAQAEIYPDSLYREREIKKAFAYYLDNERKRPTTARGWRSALRAWFDRGWSRHQASIQPTQKTVRHAVPD